MIKNFLAQKANIPLVRLEEFDENTTDNSQEITKVEERLKEIQLEKIKLRDENTEYRKLLRSEARIEAFKEEIIKAINELPPLNN